MHIEGILSPKKAPLDLLMVADPSYEAVQDYLNRGSCFVLQDDEEVRGVFVLLPTRPQTIELVNISVEETHQNKGLGKLMLKEALHIARHKGYKTMEVGTGNSSIGQLAFYQKCGFRITGVEKDFFMKHCDMIRLSKDL